MTVQAADVRAHVGRILAEEAGLLKNLEALLPREAEVLRGDDVADIERIGANRHDCIAALTRLDAERNSSCRMLNFGSGAEGFRRLLAWCDASGELQQRWDANLQSARRCRELNNRNGALVTVKLNHVQKLLSVMRGPAPSPVYAPQAQRYAAFASRNLGEA